MTTESAAEQEARVALLQHYSSKSSNQVTNILTASLAFFAFVTSVGTLEKYLGGLLLQLLSEFILVLFIGLSVHSVSRLLYWGKQADKAVSSDFASMQMLRAREKQDQFNWAKTVVDLKDKFTKKPMMDDKYYKKLQKHLEKIYFKSGCPRRKNVCLIWTV